MKKFLRKILFFLFIPFVAILIVLIWNNWILKGIILPPNISTIVCGDSHTQTAIDDSILSDCINLSNSSEHYLYSHSVLNLTLQNNPQIKRVILGISYHSFGEFYDKYIFGEKSKYMYSKYLPILDKETLDDLYRNNPLELTLQFPNTLKKIAKSIKYSKYNQFPFYGAFYKSYRSNLNDSRIGKAIQRHYYNEVGNQQEYSFMQKKYLNRIINLCFINDVDLILINTPVSIEYKKNIPKKIIMNYYNTLDSLENKFVFWDFNDLKVEDKCYGDGDHLNYLGAGILSPLIRDRIKKAE